VTSFAEASVQPEVRDVDLTQIEPEAASRPLVASDNLLKRMLPDDWTRVMLALLLVALLVVLTLGAGLYVAITPSKEPAIEAFLKLVFTPIVGLVGSVVGFYFGSRK
jgi:hypothetical protein